MFNNFPEFAISDVLFAIIFVGFWYFNYTVILSVVSVLVKSVVSLVRGELVDDGQINIMARQ